MTQKARTTEELAVNGGTPVRTKPWSAWPHYDEDEVQAVSEVLRSGKVNYWTGEVVQLEDGSKVRGLAGKFEHDFARYVGVNYAICLANGTLALELALYALGIGNGDEVIVPNRTFIASASACVMRGAVPVFADIDLDSQNLSLETIKAVYTENTKAIICVHLTGRACEMDEIMTFAEEHSLKVIEDCAQCHGGKYRDKMLGSIGHAAAFSFCQDKIMSIGGEGGMLVTNDENVYRKAWEYKDHGKNIDKYNNLNGLESGSKTFGSSYSSLGTNWRMTEMQAAIGNIQLRKLPDWVARRRKFAGILEQGLKDVYGLRVVVPPSHIFHAFYKYYVFVEPEKLAEGWTRDRIISAIAAEGVGCLFGNAWGIGLEDGWKGFQCLISGRKYDLQLKENLPNDYLVGTTAVMFQIHPTLDEEAMEDTVKAVKKVMSVAATK